LPWIALALAQRAATEGVAEPALAAEHQLLEGLS